MSVAATTSSEHSPPLALSLARWLDRAAFALLLVLCTMFAVEMRQPLLRFGGVMVLTNVEALLTLSLFVCLAAHIAARRLPRSPAQMRVPAMVWIVVLALSAAAAPDHSVQALLFVGRMIA